MKKIIFLIMSILLISTAIASEDIIKLKLFKLFKDSKTDDFKITKDYSKGILEPSCKIESIKDKFSPEKKVEKCINTTISYPRIDYEYKGNKGIILGTFQ